MRTIEFDYSRAAFSKEVPPPASISTSNPVLLFLAKFLSLFRSKYYMVYFLLISVLQVMQLDGNIEWWSSVLVMSIIILYLLIICMRNYKFKYSHLKSLTNQICYVWNSYEFEKSTIDQIRLGQVVLVQENETCPTNLLIIALGSDDNLCHVDSSTVLGESGLECKKALADTFLVLDSNQWEISALNLRRICGEISIQENQCQLFNFKGQVKLKGLPKTSRIRHENYILKGSRLLDANWIMGISLNSYYQFQEYESSRLFDCTISFFNRMLNRIVFYLFCVLIVLVIISSSVCIALSDDSHTNFTSIRDEYIRFILLYKNIIPISGFFMLYILRYIQKIIIQNSFTDKLIINNEEVLEDLGKVDYLLLDKTGTLTEAKITMKLCCVNNNLYFKETKEADNPDTDSQEFIDSSNPHDLGSSAYRSGYYNLNFEILQLDSTDDENVNHFIKCMILCTSEHNLSSEDKLISDPDEKAMILESANLGYKVLIRTSKFISLQVQDEIITYDILAFKKSSQRNFKTRIIVRDRDRTFLYIKTNKVLLSTILKELDDLEVMEDHDKVIKSTGLRETVLAYKELTDDEVSTILSKIKQATRTQLNRNYKIESLFETFEKDLTYLGSVGLEEEVSKENREAIEPLKRAGIKTWLISGDDQRNTLSSAIDVKLISSKTQVIMLNKIKTPSACLRILHRYIKRNLFQIRSERFSERVISNRRTRKMSAINMANAFINEEAKMDYSMHTMGSRKISFMAEINKDIRLPFSEQKQSCYQLNNPVVPEKLSYAVSIDECSFNIALQNEECRRMLVILLYCAKTVCFCNMLPDSKGNVAKLLKTCLKFNPTVMAVGDNSSDLMMLSEADIKVAISNSNSGLLERVSDIEVKSISQIKDLLMYSGSGIYSANSRVILLYFYINFTITLISLSYTFYSDYSGTPVFDETMIILINLLFCVFPILFIGLFNFKNMQNTPERYFKNQLRSKLNLRTVGKYAIHALAGCSIILVFTTLSLLGVLNDQGMVGNTELLRLCCLISLVFSSLVQISLEIYRYGIIYLISIFLSVLSLVIYLLISTHLYIAPYISSISFYQTGFELTSSPYLILCIILCPLIYLVYFISFKFISKFFNISPKLNYYVLSKHSSKLHRFQHDISTVYKGSSIWKTSNEPNAYNIHPISLHFSSNHIENKYRTKYIDQNRKMVRYMSIVLLFLHIGWILMLQLGYDSEDYLIILMMIYLLIYPMFFILTYSKLMYRIYIKFTVISIGMILVVKTVVESNMTILGHLSALSVPAATFISFQVDFMMICGINVENMILIIISIAVELSNPSKGYETAEVVLLCFHYLIYIGSITITSGFIGHKLEKSRRVNFQLMQRVVMEMQKSQNILSFLLPSFVKKRVKDGVRYIAEDQGVVSVMFCDICDFDKICSMYSPQELTDFLDELFQKFDILCEEYGVTKIETVGKTYMACAGLKDSENEIQSNISDISHANRTIELAFRLLNTTENIKLSNGDNLQVKIGINSGPVIAGVVGYHKPQFSLIGDTINTASRMCSTIEVPNKIQISIETFDCLDDSNNIEFHSNSIIAKGKGVLNTYFVEEKMKFEENFTVETAYIIKEIKDSNYEPCNIITPSMTIPNNTKCDLPRTLSSNILRSITPNLSIPSSSAGSSLKFNRQNTTARSLEDSKQRLERVNSIEQKLEIDVEKLNGTGSSIKPARRVSLFIDSCIETDQMKELRLKYVESNQLSLQKSLSIAVITLLLVFIVNIISLGLGIESITWEILLGKGLIIFILITILITFQKVFKHKNFGWLMIGIYVGGCLVSILYFLLNVKLPNEFVAVEIMFYILLICHSTGLFFRQILRAVLAVCIVWIIMIAYVEDVLEHLVNSIFFIGFAVINTIAVFNQESWFRYHSNLNCLAESEIKKTDGLLTQMLPPHVLNNLKQDRKTTEKLNDVTLLYADIVGFTEWSSNKTPSMVVSMLSNLFTKFDKLCVDHEVYKVHTIGDCYVVMSYTEKADRTAAQQCLNVVNFAESMLVVIDAVNKESESNLKMRIGIHTGEVIAGIIGTKIVRYDIYGPDVMTANKMESCGKPGAINVSDVTMNLILSLDEQIYEFEFNKEVSIKPVERIYNCFYIQNVLKTD